MKDAKSIELSGALHFLIAENINNMNQTRKAGNDYEKILSSILYN